MPSITYFDICILLSFRAVSFSIMLLFIFERKCVTGRTRRITSTDSKPIAPILFIIIKENPIIPAIKVKILNMRVIL